MPWRLETLMRSPETSLRLLLYRKMMLVTDLPKADRHILAGSSRANKTESKRIEDDYYLGVPSFLWLNRLLENAFSGYPITSLSMCRYLLDLDS